MYGGTDNGLLCSPTILSTLHVVDTHVEGASFTERPSLFYFVPGDRVIGIAAWTGVGLATVALLAGPYWLPDPHAAPTSMLLWAVMWGLYQSFVNAGRIFYTPGHEPVNSALHVEYFTFCSQNGRRRGLPSGIGKRFMRWQPPPESPFT